MKLLITPLPIHTSDDQFIKLLDCHELIKDCVDSHQSLSKQQFQQILTLLDKVITDSLEEQQLSLELKKVAWKRLHLLHPDYRILNLPWHWVLNHSLLINICKGLSQKGDQNINSYLPQNIDILFLISSPFDTKKVLAFEAEYKRTYNSLIKLLNKGKAKIDVLEVGDMNSFEDQLKKKSYDIIHFIGHSKLTTRGAVLEVENPTTRRSHFVSYEQFGNILEKSKKLPILVFLSSCDTALGNAETQTHSASSQLLEAGVSHVISYAHKVDDLFAARFAAFFYENLSQSRDIIMAFNDTLRVYTTSFDSIDSLLPQLYSQGPKVEQVNSFPRPLSPQKDEEAEELIGRKKELGRLVKLILAKTIINISGRPGVGKKTLLEAAINKLSKDVYSLQTITVTSLEKDYTQALLKSNTVSDVEEASNLQKQKILVYVTKNPSIQNPIASPPSPMQQEFIDFLLKEDLTLIIISIFPYPAIEKKHIELIQLHSPDFIDFFRKCEQYILFQRLEEQYQSSEMVSNELKIEDIALKGSNYKGVIHLIYEYLEGSYEQLDQFVGHLESLYFDRSFTGTDVLMELIKGEFTRELITSNNFAFSVLNSLDAEELLVLEILHKFMEPVTEFAFEFFADLPFESLLKGLEQVGVVFINRDSEGRFPFYSIATVFEKRVNFHLKERAKIDELTFRIAAVKYFKYLNTFYRSHQIARKILDVFLDMGAYQEAFEYAIPVISNLIQTSQLNDALTYGRKLVDFYEKENYEDELGILRPLLGSIYKRLGQYKEAMIEQQFYLSHAFERNDSLSEAVALDNISGLYALMLDYNNAIEYGEKAYQLFQSKGDKRHLGICAMNIGSLYLFVRNLDKARQYLEQSIELLNQVGDSVSLESAYNNLGNVYASIGNLDKALENFEKSIVILLESGRIKKTAITYVNIAHCFTKTGEYYQSLVFLKKAQNLAEKMEDDATLGKVFQEMGYLKIMRGEPKQAYDLLIASYQKFEKVGDEAESYTTLRYIGDNLREKGNLTEAIEIYTKCISYYEAKESFNNQISVLNGMSLSYHRLGQHDMALKIIEVAETIHLDKEIELDYLTTQNNKALVLAGLGLIDQALQILEAFPEADGKYDRLFKSQTFHNMGSMLMNEEGGPSRAIPFFERSIALKKELNDTKKLANSTEALASCYLLLNDYARANKLLNETLPYLEQHQEHRRIAGIYLTLAKNNLRSGEIEKAKHEVEQSKEIALFLQDQKLLVMSLQMLSDICLIQEDYSNALSLQKRAFFLISLPEHIQLTLHVGEQQRRLYQQIKQEDQAKLIGDYLTALRQILQMRENEFGNR